ncbi:MAG TPA: biosynthetic-type acetolactate synthase large subunit [Opitutaceae bacterium]|nr:biosynthetic-type acetolactate synthase large subunit [Opitutaceae bacterium]
MKITGATLLRTLLERQGIRTIAGIPGGAILPFYDALHHSAIRHILTRHEQGAGFIAQGMARVTGKAAVCLATSGPGATNLLTPIADARLDSVPLVAITGQVAQALIGTDAFQEVDTYGLTLPVTKHNFLVRHPAELLEIVPLAFQLAESGRPGPVAIDVPKDVQNAVTDVDDWPEPGGPVPAPPCSDELIEELARRLIAARRPVLYLGGGVITSGATDLAQALAHRLSAPVVCTLMALGAVPPDDSLYMGMLGMHAARGTNFLLEEADLLLAIGARFDDRATGKVAEFCPRATIAHIDIDAAEIGKIKAAFHGLVGDAANILARLLQRLPQQPRPAWRARAAELRAAHRLFAPPRASEPLHPINLCRFLGEILPPDTIVTTDVGQHQMWIAQAYPVRQPRTLLTSGGLGTMGFGLPAAIGAALAVSPFEGLAAPGRRVVCVSGDGSILMNIQELATLAELDLPVAVLVFNNAQLGLVRQQQELFYGRRYEAAHFTALPDFAALARAFGIRGVRLNPRRDPLAELSAALAAPGPCVIDIPIHEQANVYPMVPPGAANRQMIAEPELASAHA